MKKHTQTQTFTDHFNKIDALLAEESALWAELSHDIAVATGSIVRGTHELDSSPITAFRDSMLRAQTLGPDYAANFQRGYLANDRKIAAAKQGALKASL